MYVTRPLSLYYNNPGAAAEPPPGGPSSGILVIEDEEAEAQTTCCWGCWRDVSVSGLPFPQNRIMEVQYTTSTSHNTATGSTHHHVSRDHVFFIPVLNQPLSSNRYYVVEGSGRNKGKISTSSREEDMATCCFCNVINDVKPTVFDHRNIYQQVEVMCRSRYKFQAKAVASDGFPPEYLRRKGWGADKSTPKNFHLTEALGLNAALRNQMPDLNFNISLKTSPAKTVGRWYCPFMFVKEGDRLKDQMKSSMFYEMTLEQYWEQIYDCVNYQGGNKVAEVSVSVRREMALLNGNEVVQDNFEVVDGVVWFNSATSTGKGLGLSSAIWERMRWEEARGGWSSSGEKVERVERVEVYEGENEWKEFGCYILVERFVLRRMDGSLALTYDFKHTNKMRTKWN